MNLRYIYVLVLSLLVAVEAAAAPIDDAKRLYHNGDYEQAVTALRKILKTKPKDGTANYYLGASLMALGDRTAAREALVKAEDRGVGEASRMLAEDDLDHYRAEEANKHLGVWQANLVKAKKSEPAEFAELQSRTVKLRNMLDRVERIEIIDTISVDSADFFNAYRLSSAAGRIVPPDAVRRLGIGGDAIDISTAYMPQNNSEILWASADTAGVYNLYSANILDDGTIDHSAALDPMLGGGGSARYPFLMPDGVTLYYASDGDGSLGGYDIFMTRRNENEEGAYYQPQNMGMPYNSPDNDFMLAIDESSNLGWFATDRNHIPGKLTVYVFAPSAMRVNADRDDPNLASLARLDNIALTRKADVDYADYLEKHLPAADSDKGSPSAPQLFAIDMGNGRVYTSLSDFRNPQARSAMLEALATRRALEQHLAAENELRDKYRRGSAGVAADIVDSEAETNDLRRRLSSQINNAIRLETNHK